MEQWLIMPKKELKTILDCLSKLYYQIKDDKIDESFLKDINKKDCLFPDIDYNIYRLIL